MKNLTLFLRSCAGTLAFFMVLSSDIGLVDDRMKSQGIKGSCSVAILNDNGKKLRNVKNIIILIYGGML
jgi:hypothetical protein